MERILSLTPALTVYENEHIGLRMKFFHSSLLHAASTANKMFANSDAVSPLSRSSVAGSATSYTSEQ
jgi:hypothetical protein